MPRLPSPKLEAFACELAQGARPIDAAERAGFARSKSHASERYRRADVQARVAELRAERGLPYQPPPMPAVFRATQQETFAQAIALGQHAVEAAEAAGYVPTINGAGARLRGAEVRARVAQLQAEIAERAVEIAAIDKSWVMRRLQENVERAMSIEPVLDGKGHPTGVYKYQGSVANRALELLGKELGMFIDRNEVKTSMEIRLEPMTRAERLAYLEGARKYLPAGERDGDTTDGESTTEGDSVEVEPDD
jgi:phage terminase small subunit